MKTKKKTRMLSLLLTLAMIISIVPLGALNITASATSSNEEKIYNYFINTMKVNTAVACGVLANIKAESNFNPTSSCVDVNNKTSYGICQWNGGRFSNLKSFCNKKGLDYTKLEAQLAFLKSELEGSEKTAWAKVKGKENSEQGAYGAGYAWAKHFERCAEYYNGSNQFVKRGNSAKTYWKKYGSTTITDSYEYAMFPFDELYISRTNKNLDPYIENVSKNGGHVKFAFDLIGSDKKVKAPFTGKIVYISNGGQHDVILQSINKVHTANGKLDYVSIMFTHDDDISDLYVGKIIKQDEVFYEQGTFGNGKKGTYGKHLHIEAAIGKCNSISTIRSKGAHLNDVVFLSTSTTRTKDYIRIEKKNGGGKINLKWRVLELKKPNAPKIYLNQPNTDIAVNDQISISWAKVSNATSYAVYVNDKNVANITGTSYAFKATEAISYTVKVCASNSSGTSSASNIITVSAHEPCKVTFVNWDGTPLTAEPILVGYGKNVVAPEIPLREGYTFTNWNLSLQNITEDCTIEALFKINTYTVKFFDSKGNVLSSQNIEYLGAATPPENVNAPTGYDFNGWSTEEFTSVKKDLNIYGIYNWGNTQLPIVLTNVTATRQQDGYYVYFDLTNYPDAITRGRAVVSLKTAEGKLIDTTESAAFSIPKDGTKSQMEVFVPSDEVASQAEVIIVNSYSSGVPISEMKSAEITMSDNMWTNWSDTAPAEGTYSDIETRTLYRSSDKETSTATTPTKDGWTYYETTSTVTTGSTTSKVTAFSNDAQTRTVTTRKVNNYEERTEYRYSHYQKGASTSPVKYSGWNGPHYTAWLTSALEEDGKSTAGGAKYKSKKCATCELKLYWYNQETRKVKYVASTTTYYDYVDTFYTYHFYRWMDWTDWTTDTITATDDKQVETKTQYRYISNGVINEDTTGIERTINGNVGTAYAGKQLSLFIYKVDEASDYSNEFVGQQTVAADGSYSFTFKLREEPSVKTGDFTVAIGLEGSNNTMIIDTIKAPKPTFEVKFMVDGKQIGETQTVEQGSAAVLPDNPTKEGYTFCGWSADITNVQCDLEVEANFAINKYTVVFVDWVTETVSIKEFEYGAILSYDEATEIEGYTFAGWEELEDLDAVVTQNMVLTAKYDKDVFDVVFYDFDGNEISRQSVEYGESAEIPEEPYEENMIFCGWDSEEDIYIVTCDTMAYADFLYEETCEQPYADITTNEFTEAQTITLACDTPNSTIYYTTDGTNPTEMSEYGNTVKLYTEPITVSKNCVLKFYATCDEMNASEIMTETYVISTGSFDSDLMTYDDLPTYVISNPSKYNVHTEIGYKYKNVTTTSFIEESYDLENDGWTQDGYTYGEWSEWSITEPDANGMIIETESKQPDPVDTPYYQYKHWKYYDEETQTYVCTSAEVEGYEGEWETIDFVSSLAMTSFVGGKPAYSYNDELWFDQKVVSKEITPDYLIYRYRVVTNNYYKWTEWTSVTPVDGDTRENTSEMVFRYTVPSSHLVTVHANGENGDINYIVFENELVSIDMEMIEINGYTISGFYSDEEYENSWDIENDVVMTKLDLYPKYDVIKSTVTFVDVDDELIFEQEVDYGESATAPEYIAADGYTFLGWDNDFGCVTEDITIKAKTKLTADLVTVTLNSNSKTIYADSLYKLIATVSPEDAADKTLTWASSNEDIATVDENGIVTAISTGTAVITATTVDGISDACTIIVRGNDIPESITISSKEVYVTRYSTKQITCSVTPAGANADVVWTSTNPSIATVDENGSITGNMAGSTIVIATTADGSRSDYCLVKVIGIDLLSTASIDFENGIISGISANLDSLDGYIELSDNTCELTYDSLGTDSIVYLTRDNEVIDAYTVVVFGDVNGDSWYDGTDAMIVNCIVNGMLTREQVGEAVWTAADCNHDGMIDELDVALLNEAGLLLSQVDQTKSEEELQTDSIYQEYLNLIDQNPTVEETEEPTVEPEKPAKEKKTFADLFKTIFEVFINYFKSLFVITK